MAKTKTTPWNKIKAEYLQGAAPRELAAKYGLTAKQVSNKANIEKWASENKKIKEKVSKNAQDYIQQLVDLALSRLAAILESDSMRACDHIAAAKAILEISGLKNIKQDMKEELPTININGVKI